MSKFYINSKQLPSGFHCSWQNFPLVKSCNDTTIYYLMGSDGGFFFDDKRCLLQLMRGSQLCTVHICNDGGFIDNLHGNYAIDATSLNGFDRYFNVATPSNIRKCFPLLDKMVEHKTKIPSFEFYDLKDYGASFSMNRREPLQGSTLTDSQVELVLSLVDCVLEIEKEYLSFTKSLYFKTIDKILKEQKPTSDNFTTYLTIVRLLSLGMKILNLGELYGDIISPGESVALLPSNDTLTQFNDNSELINLSVSPADRFDTHSSGLSEVSDFGNDDQLVSFTGNQDHSDEIKSLQREFDDATHDIDYYQREIRNFNDRTTDTYRSNCLSALKRATGKAAELARKIQNLKNS